MTIVFDRVQGSRLFQARNTAADGGWFGLYYADDVEPPGTQVDFATALADEERQPNFIFTLAAPEFSDSDANTIDDFLKAIEAALPTIPSARFLVWLPLTAWQRQFDRIGRDITITAMSFEPDGGKLRSQTTIALATGLSAIVATGADLAVDAEAGQLTMTTTSGNALSLDGANLPTQRSVYHACSLALTGPGRGRLTGGMSLAREDMSSGLAWGFKYAAPGTGGTRYETLYAPLASEYQPVDQRYLEFEARIDPRDPQNVRSQDFLATAWFFADDPVLVSGFRSEAGRVIHLRPVTDPRPDGTEERARLVIQDAPGTSNRVHPLHMAPAGDFVLQPPEGAPHRDHYRLQVGLTGVEVIAYQGQTNGYAGDRIRFVPGHGGSIPQLPLPEASPLSAPVDLQAALLSPTPLATAWASVRRAPGSAGQAAYVAQPKGQNLFAKSTDSDAKTLLPPADPAVPLNASTVFPLVPYGLVEPTESIGQMSRARIELLSRQILAPVRRARIGGADASTVSARAALGLTAPDDGETHNFTTPTGLLATAETGKPTWTRLVLGRNYQPQELTMGFENLHPKLQQAFQTNDLLLIVANPALLGAYDSPGCTYDGQAGSDARFNNTMNVGGWRMSANVGRGNGYGQYRNVMIVKGVKGKLTELVDAPGKWTQKNDFAAPASLSCQRPDAGKPPACGAADGGDTDQLVILGDWLRDYFDTALKRGDDPYFQTFNAVIQDPNWTGILVLKADIDAVPDEIAGIVQGVETQQFYAHHFGVNITPIDGEKLEITQSSSVFGLIDYVDPDFDDAAQTKTPVAPPAGKAYDFKVLTLKALFENTAVKLFESWAQVTLNRLFGDQVVELSDGNANNTMLLSGSYQQNGKAPVYALSTRRNVGFELKGQVLATVQIDSARFSTISDGGAGGKVVSWIGMTGRLQFAKVEAPGAPFDVFSFGRADGGTGQNADDGGGLSFTDLGLRMVYDRAAGDPEAASTLALDTSNLAFDQTGSQVRPGSLVDGFALQVKGLVTGDKDTPPSKKGFLSVVPDANFNGVDGGDWSGLDCTLKLGTLGALADNAGFHSDLLLAWAPGVSQDRQPAKPDGGDGDTQSYNAAIGLRMPGTGDAPLFSFQSVLKLSFGVVRLSYATEGKTTGFLLLLNEIALKFLSFLKIPPNGSTAFYLFGGSGSGGSGDPSGLGWYAIYNQKKPKKDGDTSALTSSRGD